MLLKLSLRRGRKEGIGKIGKGGAEEKIKIKKDSFFLSQIRSVFSPSFWYTYILPDFGHFACCFGFRQMSDTMRNRMQPRNPAITAIRCRQSRLGPQAPRRRLMLQLEEFAPADIWIFNERDRESEKQTSELRRRRLAEKKKRERKNNVNKRINIRY